MGGLVMWLVLGFIAVAGLVAVIVGLAAGNHREPRP